MISNTYTFTSDAHNTTSWLDHCVISDKIKHKIKAIEMDYCVDWLSHKSISLCLSTATLNCPFSFTKKISSFWVETAKSIKVRTTKISIDIEGIINIKDISYLFATHLVFVSSKPNVTNSESFEAEFCMSDKDVPENILYSSLEYHYVTEIIKYYIVNRIL